jgi:hypothetical protein
MRIIAEVAQRSPASGVGRPHKAPEDARRIFEADSLPSLCRPQQRWTKARDLHGPDKSSVLDIANAHIYAY